MSRVHFPRDEGSHPVGTEWWYYNGFLTSEDGTEYSFMLTFFKINFAKGRLLDVLPTKFHRMLFPLIEGRAVNAHISDLTNRQFYPEYVHYGALPVITHALPKKMHVHFGRELAKMHKHHQHIMFSRGKNSFRLRLKSRKKPIMWGDGGVIPMGEKGDSYYYSLTRLNTEGTLTIQGKTKRVKGIAWLDHQWGDWDLLDDRWTWFSIQLSDDTDLMIFSFKNTKSREKIRFAGIAGRNGRVEMLNNVQIIPKRYWKSPKTKKRYATSYEIRLPERKMKLRVDAYYPAQEMTDPRSPPYYEGACAVSGTVGKRKVKGRAYLEMADFDKSWIKRKYG